LSIFNARWASALIKYSWGSSNWSRQHR
jgi:hypothetical protein